MMLLVIMSPPPVRAQLKSFEIGMYQVLSRALHHFLVVLSLPFGSTTMFRVAVAISFIQVAAMIVRCRHGSIPDAITPAGVSREEYAMN